MTKIKKKDLRQFQVNVVNETIEEDYDFVVEATSIERAKSIIIETLERQLSPLFFTGDIKLSIYDLKNETFH